MDQEFDPEFATSEPEAVERAKSFKRFDPFPDIPPALLSSADIEDYVRVTAMLFPFPTNAAALRDVLKPASYEVRPGGKFVWWQDNGERVEENIREDEAYELPPNSIRYMQIESTVRLPDYIAIRFNLRIKHVHRGLLLGTGPLVDPGFEGNILIPLHNLTSEAHRIRGNEGLIWVEFTKTAAKVEIAKPPYRRRGVLHPMEDRKADVSISSYFQRANEGRPIRSSIPEAVKDATLRAEQAEKSATQARNIGFIAGAAIFLTLVIGFYTYFAQLYSDIQASLALASTVSSNANQALAGATRALDNQQILRRDLEDARTQIETLRGQLAGVTRELQLQGRGMAPIRPPAR